MAFRSSDATEFNFYTTLSVPVPAGVQSGDIVLVWIQTDLSYTAMQTVTPPSGFTLKYEDNYPDVYNHRVYWKRLTGADSGTYDFARGGECACWGIAAAFSGRIASGDPFSAEADVGYATSTANFDNLAVTAAAGDDAVEILCGFTNATISNDAAWTEREYLYEADLATIDNVSAGTVDDTDSTFGTSSALYNRIMLLIPPAAAGGLSIPLLNHLLLGD